MPEFNWGSENWGERNWGARGPVNFFDLIPPWISTGRLAGKDPVIEVRSSDGSWVNVTLTGSRETPYSLEVHEVNGDNVAYIDDWWDGWFEEAFAEVATLEFTIEFANTSRSSVTAARRIWLRDRYGFVIGTFRASRPVFSQKGEVTTARYFCQNSLIALSNQVVTSYTTSQTALGITTHTKTVLQIVTDLLDEQVGTTKVGLGVISPQIATLTRSLDVSQGAPILQALRRLQRSLPLAQEGYLWVDSENLLNWSAKIGLEGHELTTSTNLLGLEAEYLEEELITGLVIFGEGQDPRTRLSLLDAGEGSTMRLSSNFDADDPRVALIIEPRIRDADTLADLTTRILEERDIVKVQYRANVINLAYADGAVWVNWDDIYMGSQMRLEASDIGENAYVNVRRTRKSLDGPLEVQVDLGNQTRSVASILSDFFERGGTPLNVNDDHSRYPNVARTYDGTEINTIEGLSYASGDFKVESGVLYFHDGSDWIAILSANDFEDTGGNIQPIAAVAAAGTDSKVPRAQHEHPAVWVPRP